MHALENTFGCVDGIVNNNGAEGCDHGSTLNEDAATKLYGTWRGNFSARTRRRFLGIPGVHFELLKFEETVGIRTGRFEV